MGYGDYRASIHQTLKRKPMREEDLADSSPATTQRPAQAPRNVVPRPTRRPLAQIQMRRILARDKTSLDTFLLKNKSLADIDNLPDPKDLGEEIVENIEAGLNNFRVVLAALGS